MQLDFIPLCARIYLQYKRNEMPGYAGMTQRDRVLPS